MMNNALFLTILLIITLHNSAIGDECNIAPVLLGEIESKSLRSFFNALKNGNVEVIKRRISGDMYEESRILLEENRGYPDYLREYYKGAIFSVERAVPSDSGILVDIAVEFPGRGKQLSRLHMQEEFEYEKGSRGQQTAEKYWRITGQSDARVR